MSNGLWLAVVGMLGAAISPFLTYYITKRKSSGKISTTEADTLWAQAQELLTRYKQDIQDLRSEVAASRVEMEALRTELAELRREAAHWRQEAERFKEELAALGGEG